jgi:hypothetical protein
VIEQQAQALAFFAFFTASKLGKTGLTVTVDVRDPSGTLVVTGGTATEHGGGLYRYSLAGGSNNANGGWTAVFKTADATVDQQHVPALWVVAPVWTQKADKLPNTTAGAVGGVPVLGADGYVPSYGFSGSLDFTYTTRDANGNVLPYAAVYVSSDAGGLNRSYTLIADVLGRTRWKLNPGDAWFWNQHPAWNFTNPDHETVSNP